VGYGNDSWNRAGLKLQLHHEPVTFSLSDARRVRTPHARPQHTHTGNYSITACSAGADWARSAVRVEPIMTASGIDTRMNVITSW